MCTSVCDVCVIIYVRLFHAPAFVLSVICVYMYIYMCVLEKGKSV